MHGCSSGSVLLVNAEVDSMGGVVDGGAGIGVKTSPRRVAIEKAQAELRQEFDVREERRKELEFLEKGGNPLDFKFENAPSLSVQSISLTDQHPEQFVTSEVKGSFALTASPHGDSVDSSGRPGTHPVCEPNSADNLLLFDDDNELPEIKKNSVRPVKRSSVAPSEQSSHARESEDSTIFRPYRRRNRSRSNRDGARSSSTDIIQNRGGHGSLVARGSSRDIKGSISEANKQKNQNMPSISNPKSASSNGDMVPKIAASDKQLDMELGGMQGGLASRGPKKGCLPERKLKAIASKDGMDLPPSQIDDQQPSVKADVEQPDAGEGKEQNISAPNECPPCTTTTATVLSENEAGSGPLDRLNNLKVDRKTIPNEVQSRGAASSIRGLDSESSCTQTSLCLDANNDSEVCTNQRNVSFNENSTEQQSKHDGFPNIVSREIVKEANETKAATCGVIGNDDPSIYLNHTHNGSSVKVEEDVHQTVSGEQNKVKHPPSNMEGVENSVHGISGSDKIVGVVHVDESNINKENSSTNRPQSLFDVPASELPATTLLGKNSASEPGHSVSDDHLKLANKAHEDSVLEEAEKIEAKRKGIAELSVHILPSENRQKSHWDFVLEEMAWLANDFAQERLWKITAASQMGRLAASASRLKFEQQSQHRKLIKVAHTMANTVMQFWHSVEMLQRTDISSIGSKNEKYNSIDSKFTDGNRTTEDKIEEPDMKTSKELQSPRKSLPLALQEYAVRFLKSTSSPVPPLQAEAPATPEKISDIGTTEISWPYHLTEENLFYTVPSGAMEAYRKSIESHSVQAERTSSSMQEDVEMHIYDSVADYGYQESTYDEDEGETSTYYLPGAFDGNRSFNLAQKKRNHLMKSYSARSYEMHTGMPHGQLKTGAQQSMVMGKRPANNLNVGAIPTKRMRTATRQRVLSPFGAGGTGGVQAPAKTDASSGDTNSFQDDQSTMRGGSQLQRNVEVESGVGFTHHMPYDSAETSTKPKKKKKRHLDTSYDLGWQLDTAVHTEQRDHFKKRAESHHFDSNGPSGGLYGQPNAKRPKTMKQPLDNTSDNISLMTGSVPSPAASMSNMSNPNKFIKLMGGRDRGRKAKGLKISPGQPGSESPWSLFEDQALVVLVHDMGPNWELVSDAVSSTLQFKCIFRKPKECKERHKILMDRSAGDGADSAEDSGSCQSYPSTLPGIPKGSARQLFQCLQGPMVEDTLKSHFEKIIAIGQKQHYRRSQNNHQDPKQIAQVHNSHVIALSQAFPNNLNGSVLTPLDLCDTTPSSPEVLPLGYQGSHSGGLPMSNQGAVASMLPTSGPSSSVQGSSGMALGSTLQSPSGPLGASARFGVPRPLPIDEHQRMQQYNQMLSSRNIQQPNLSVPGALPGTDRGARMNGIVPGMHRNLPMARPGFQSMTSSSMLNSGGMAGMPSSGMHSGSNSMLRPRDALQMMRPGHNSDHQRQMMVPEHPMQVNQGNTQGVAAPFNGLSTPFSNQPTPPAQAYPVHTQPHQVPSQQPHVHTNPHLQVPNHASGSQHQAYAMRVAKERQQQQRYLQQQQQFSASNSLSPQAQAPPQHHPVSSSQTTPQQPVSLPPLTPTMAPLASQHQQKHHLQSGPGRNPQAPNSGLSNQMGKQRQRQQFQQPGRHNPQQRQHAQSQQQPKVLKGMGRGNMNGLTVAAGSQSGENQGSYPGSALNSVQPSKPLVPSPSSNQSQLQQKVSSSQAPSKQLQQMPSHSDNSVQSQVAQLGSGHTYSASRQASPPMSVSSNNQQMQQKPVSLNQPVQRMLQPNRQGQSDLSSKAAVDQGQERPSVNNDPQKGTTPTCTDSLNAGPIVSSAVTPQLKASEPVCDSGVPSTATQVAAIGSPTLPSSAGSEPSLRASEGLGQRQLSGGSLLHGHKTGTQSHQQPQSSMGSPHLIQQVQPPEQPPPILQEPQQDQQFSSPQPVTSQQPSQQQTQHLQSEQGSLYIEPTTSKLGGN